MRVIVFYRNIDPPMFMEDGRHNDMRLSIPSLFWEGYYHVSLTFQDVS